MMATPKLVNKQFNSPIKMYSPQAIQETLDRQTQVLSNGAVGIDFNQLAKPTNLQNSAVLRMLEEEEERKRLGKAGLKRVAWPPPAEDQGDLADYSEQGPVQSKDIPIIVEQPVKQPPQQYQSNLRQPSQFISQQPPTGAKPWISSQIPQQQQHQQQPPQQWHQQPQQQQHHPDQWQQQQQYRQHPQHLQHQDSGNTIINTWNKEDLKRIQSRQQQFDQTTEILASPPVTNPWNTDKPHHLIHQQHWKESAQHNQQTEFGHQDHQSPQFYYQPQNTAPNFEPPPSTITLRPELPISQEPAPVYQAQPAAINPNSGSMRGDQKWPPQSVRDQTEAENKARVELAKGPVCRPRRVNKDYSGFFAQHAVTNNYPGYRAPPGTQYFTPAYQH